MLGKRSHQSEIEGSLQVLAHNRSQSRFGLILGNVRCNASYRRQEVVERQVPIAFRRAVIRSVRQERRQFAAERHKRLARLPNLVLGSIDGGGGSTEKRHHFPSLQAVRYQSIWR